MYVLRVATWCSIKVMKIERNKERVTLSEAARLAGVSRDTVRRWERRGLFTAKRDWRGARIFTEADINRLRMIAGIAPVAEQ